VRAPQRGSMYGGVPGSGAPESNLHERGAGSVAPGDQARSQRGSLRIDSHVARLAARLGSMRARGAAHEGVAEVRVRESDRPMHLHIA
jgi:hypothetical protein